MTPNDFDPVIEATRKLGEAIDAWGQMALQFEAMLTVFQPELEAEAAIEAEHRAWAMADRDNYVRPQLRQRIYKN